ncbi:GNAT family N-acetyltransferase [Brevibacillus dissolubilis]|uniref:GNAT family N-acetyltransferase n=1 Tax=Brevibacillus dissolubilis TaxID=1844116 RepID=UPI0011179D81|nr:GNAT family N-acetyltransferase [Brevibacillus dissolubilis]
MNNIKSVLEEQSIAYKMTFSPKIERPWGYFFCHPENPTHYDANHAHVLVQPEQPEQVIDEVVGFFQEKGIIPRFYLYDPANCQELIERLQAHGFGYEEFAHPVQLWNGKVTAVASDPAIVVEPVTEANYQDAVDIEVQIKELGGSIREKAFEQEFRDPNFEHFLLRYNGVPVSTACIFANGDQAQMESVATLEAYRGKGLIGHVIRHIQEVARERNYRHFWVFPISEQVERVYQRHGFDTIEQLTMGHAFLGGKSILEIREG